MFSGVNPKAREYEDTRRNSGHFNSNSIPSNSELKHNPTSHLRLMASDRDPLQREIHKTQADREAAYRRLAMSGDTVVTSSLSNLNKNQGVSVSDRSLNGGRDFDHQRGQQDHLHFPRQQQEISKSGAVAREEFSLSKQKQVKSEEHKHEALKLKKQYSELLADKHRLDQEGSRLQKFTEDYCKEASELRRQQQALSDSGSGDTAHRLHQTAVRKCEALKEEYDALHKRYADLVASHSAAVSKLELAQEELMRLRKNFDECVQERNVAIRERNGLQQQCTAAIRQWDNALRERNEAREQLSKVQQQRDEAMKEINQAMAVRIKATKDLARLTEERNAAVQEYSLIMSERDSVHKEIERLQEELSEAQKKVKNMEGDNKAAREEVESLRREIASALQDRDRALKECNDLREKYGDFVTGRDDGLRDPSHGRDYDHRWEWQDYENRHEGERTASWDSSNQDNPNKTHAQKLDDLDQANMEIEALRRQVERLQSDLVEAQQEADVCKRRRDWAFSERDKIVLERESIRTLCDKLRRERDRAVSDLAEALRDSDDIKRQKNEASKELKELREKIESQMEKESRMKQLNSVGNNYSRDSAIDTDMQEWETETLEVTMRSSSDDDWGFDLIGGKEDPVHAHDVSIYVNSINKGSIADGKLRLNDCVLKMNGIDLTNAERRVAVDTKRNSKGVLTMLIRRRRATSSRGVQTVALNLTGSQEHGIVFEHGIYISHILPGSVAAREGNLAVGDRLLMVNGKSLEGVHSVSEVMRTIDMCGPHLVLQMAKCNPCPSSPPSSASSGHNLIERVNGEKVSASRTNSGTAPSSPAKDSEASSWSDKETKLTSSGVQTEDIHFMASADKHSFLPTSVIRGKSSSKGDRTFSQSSQPTLLDRAYHRIFGERRHGSKEKKPQCVQEVPPLYANDEDDPIAELDSVLDHHSKPSFTKSSKSSRSKKDRERNGGTWPKCRGPPLHFTEIGTVTTLHTHKKKERKSLVAFTKQISSYDFKGQTCVSDQASNSHFACGLDQCAEKALTNNATNERVPSTYLDFQTSPQSPEHSVPGDMQMRGSASMSSSSSSARTSSVVSSYSSPPSGSPHKSARGSQSSERLDAVSSLHFSGNTSPDTSLDYSVVSAHRDKDVLEFYKNRSKQRPRSAHYIFSDSECLSPIEPLPVPPQFGKPFASLPIDRTSYGHNEPLSLSPPLSERSHTPRSSEHMYHSAVPTSLSSRGVASQALLRGGVAFYTISSGQRGITHSHLHHPHNLGTGCVVTAGSVPPSARYSSPPGLSVYTSRSGDSLLSGSTAESASGPETRSYHSRLDGRPFSAKDGGRYSVTPSPSPSQYSYFGPSPSQSMDLVPFHSISTSHPNKRLVPAHAHVHSGYRSDDPYGPSSFDGLSTFPKGKQRIRIPSNPSVTSKSSAGKMSTSSIEKASSVSERGSPMPAFTVEWLGSGGSHTLSCDMRGRKPNPGDLRCICIEKSSEPLGIQISCGNNGGIFVSSVSENSLAAQAGLQVGDQLLEVCGINMRSATYILAANVLRQCGDSITMLVQYSPDKYQESVAESGSSDDPSPTHTPAPSPKTPLNHTNPTSPTIDLSGEDAPSSATSTLTRQKAAAKNSLVGETSSSPKNNSAEPRLVVLKKTTSNLGISLLGGNAVGIFVHSVQEDSPVSGSAGLQPGDQILEYNGVDLRNATAEEAAYELAKPADSVTVVAQYNMDKYVKIQDQPGDSFYIRALFDRPSIDGSLAFRKDDVLYVDNTMFNGVPGLWRAWLVDQEGEKVKCGVIPSKYKVEEELLMRRSLGEGENGECTRRGSTSARRSFFRRRRHHRSSSRDSKELASFSDVSINSCSDSGTIGEELVPPTYLRVERLDYLNLRPVILVGPLMEAVLEKLEQDFPHMFQRCFPELLRGSQQLMEHGLQDLRFIDLRRKGSHVECISATAVKEICDKNLHALLDVSLSAVERLHRCQIYPIVIFMKFKSIKQIREVKDSRYLTEKVTTKAAKEMYEHALKIESEYRHFINVVIPGSNLAYMCTQVKTCVEDEQRKTLWVPSGTI